MRSEQCHREIFFDEVGFTSVIARLKPGDDSRARLNLTENSFYIIAEMASGHPA
jgi:hypothetical protein